MSAHAPPHEPRYRWVVVAAASVVLGIAMGTLVNGLSAFMLPLRCISDGTEPTSRQ